MNSREDRTIESVQAWLRHACRLGALVALGVLSLMQVASAQVTPPLSAQLSQQEKNRLVAAAVLLKEISDRTGMDDGADRLLDARLQQKFGLRLLDLQFRVTAPRLTAPIGAMMDETKNDRFVYPSLQNSYIIAGNDQVVLVVIRGTDGADNEETNSLGSPAVAMVLRQKTVVHPGFLEMAQELFLRRSYTGYATYVRGQDRGPRDSTLIPLKDRIETYRTQGGNTRQLILAGHSLGGAMVVYGAALLDEAGTLRATDQLITFGMPNCAPFSRRVFKRDLPDNPAGDIGFLGRPEPEESGMEPLATAIKRLKHLGFWSAKAHAPAVDIADHLREAQNAHGFSTALAPAVAFMRTSAPTYVEATMSCGGSPPRQIVDSVPGEPQRELLLRWDKAWKAEFVQSDREHGPRSFVPEPNIGYEAPSNHSHTVNVVPSNPTECAATPQEGRRVLHAMTFYLSGLETLFHLDVADPTPLHVRARP